VSDPKKRPSSICLTLPNVVAVGKTVWALIEVPKIRGAGPPPLGDGAYMTSRNTSSLLDKSYDDKFGRSMSNSLCVITEILR